MVGLANLGQEVRTAAEEAIVLESPVLGFLTVFGVLDAERVTLNLAESVKVELTDKGAKVVVL